MALISIIFTAPLEFRSRHFKTSSVKTQPWLKEQSRMPCFYPGHRRKQGQMSAL